MSQRTPFFASLQNQSTTPASSPAGAPPTTGKPQDTPAGGGKNSAPLFNVEKILNAKPNPKKRQYQHQPRSQLTDTQVPSLDVQPELLSMGMHAVPGTSNSLDALARSESRRSSTASTLVNSRSSTDETSLDTEANNPLLSSKPKNPVSQTPAPDSSRRRASLSGPGKSKGKADEQSMSRTPVNAFSGPSPASRHTLLDVSAHRTPASTDDVLVLDSNDEPQSTIQHQQQSSQRRSRSTYEADDALFSDNRFDAGDGPVTKKAKPEPIDMLSLRSSSVPDASQAVEQESQRSDLGTLSQEPLRAPASSQRPVSQEGPPGDITMIEEINDNFELYLHEQHEKAENLRQKWLECSLEEWEAGGKEIFEKFSGLIDFVKNGMKSKLEAFTGISTRVADHSKTLDEREQQLKAEKEMLVQQTRSVIKVDTHW